MQEKDESKRGAKKGVDLNAGTQRLRDRAVALRSKKREDTLREKRQRGGGIHENEEVHQDPSDPFSYTTSTKPQFIPLQLLPQFAELVISDNPEWQYHGTVMIRKLLSVENNPPIDEVIQSGVAPNFVHFMLRDQEPLLQFEAAWALTNISSGSPLHSQYVLQINAVPNFITLLASCDDDCREQATWALGNLAGDSAKCRDYLLSLGCLDPLMQVVQTPDQKISVKRNAVWALSNLCRSKPPPALEVVQQALPLLGSLLHDDDDEVITDAAWAISYISDGSNDRIQLVLVQGVLPRLVELLAQPRVGLVTPAIRSIGNFVTGNDQQTQVVINSGALACMHFLLSHAKRGIRKETCWAISNITAGHRDQLQAIINANLFPPLLRCMYATEFEVRKEAVWAVANATSGGSIDQVRYLVEIEVLCPLCDLLSLFDVKVVSVALEAIENVLAFGEQERADRGLLRNEYATRIIEIDGLRKIEDLQHHTNNDVYMQAMSILDTFFDSDDAEVENLAPQAQNSGYAFSAPSEGNNFTFEQEQ